MTKSRDGHGGEVHLAWAASPAPFTGAFAFGALFDARVLLLISRRYANVTAYGPGLPHCEVSSIV